MSKQFKKKKVKVVRPAQVKMVEQQEIPLEMDYGKLMVMADFYLFAIKNKIPFLYMKRVLKSVRGLIGKNADYLKPILAIHTDKHVVDCGDVSWMGGINYNVYLKLQSGAETKIYGMGCEFSSEHDLISSLKKEWSIPVDNGRQIYLLGFPTLESMDKALGITETSEKSARLIKEVLVFDDLLSKTSFDICGKSGYQTVQEQVSRIAGDIFKTNDQIMVLERDVA